MWLFLILGPAVFAGLLFTNAFRSTFREQGRLFLLGLVAAVPAAALQYLTRYWFPVTYGSLWGCVGFWFRDFFWCSLAGFLPLVLVPALKEKSPDRKARFLSFLLGAVSPAGILTYLYQGPPRDLYFVLYLPLIRIALAVFLALAADAVLTEYGAVLGLWIGLAVLAGPLVALVPVFHFWNAAILALPFLLIVLGAGWLCLREIAPLRRRG